MGKTTGFLEYPRVDEDTKKVEDRLKNYNEFTLPLEEKKLQGARRSLYGLRYSVLSQRLSTW